MNIDLTLLLSQKTELVGLAMENQTGTMASDPNFLSEEQASALDGIINLLDSIGDELIDGKTPEFKRVNEEELNFPNGFEAWTETHHVMVENVERMLYSDEDAWAPKLHKAQTEGGMGGIWLLCRELTDKFEQENIGVEWDGEWFDAIDAFLEKELN